MGVGGGISYNPYGEVSPHAENAGSGYIGRTTTNGSIGIGAGTAGSGASFTAATGNAVTTKNGGGYTSGSGTAQFGWNPNAGFGVRGELLVGAEFGSYSSWGSPNAVSDDDLLRFCEQNPGAPNCNNDCP